MILGICKRTQSAEGSAGADLTNQTGKVIWPGFSLTEPGINLLTLVCFPVLSIPSVFHGAFGASVWA